MYPFYILHQTIIVILGYYLANLNWMIGGKFLLISIATFLICWLFYEVVRRTALTRLLFGIKKESAPKSIRSVKSGLYVSEPDPAKMTKA